MLSTILTLLLATTLISAQEPSNTSSSAAPLATNQPSRHTYQAILQLGKPIHGLITGVSSDTGTGVTFNLNFYDFPDLAAAGPFAYHIHTNPIAEDGNCSSAMGHLRPFNSPPDNFTCNPAAPSFCQVGDLSGKHGKLGVSPGPSELTNGGKLMQAYTDDFVSAIEGSEAFFGNRSIVVHAANGTRLNCASFVRVGADDNGGANNNNSSSSSAPAGPTGTSSVAPSGPAATRTASPSVTGSATSGTASQPSPSSITSVSAAGVTVPVSWASSTAGVTLVGGLALLMASWL